MTLPLIPGVRPDPEPGAPHAAYTRHANAILDLLDRVGLSLTNVDIDRALGWRDGTAGQWTWAMIARGDLVSTEREGRYKLYRRPAELYLSVVNRHLSDSGP